MYYEMDEGKRLLNSGERNTNSESLVDRCINNPKPFNSYKIAFVLGLGNAADAVEIMCVGFIMAEINGITSADKALLSASVFVGMFLGGIIGGLVSDSLGRKRALLIALLLNSVAGLASALSPSISFLIVCRVLAGLGIGASAPIVFSLGAEVFPSDVRGYLLSIIASFWMVGAIYTALTAWLMLGKDIDGNKIIPGVDWRWFAVAAAFPSLLAFICSYFILKESPRFLIKKNLIDEAVVEINNISTIQIDAHDLLNDLHGSGLSSRSGSGDSQREISSSQVKEKTSSSSYQNFMNALKTLFGDKFRKTSIVLMVIWFTLSFGSYGISTWISVLFEDVGISNAYAAAFIFAMANLPGNLISFVLIDVYGRRWLLSAGMVLAALSCLAFALNSTNQIFVVLFASLFNAFSILGWNSLDCLSAEGFPTSTRSTAMGILAATGRVGAICGEVINGVLEKNIPLLLFVTSACCILGGCVSWLLPHDTMGSIASLESDDEGAAEKVDPEELPTSQTTVNAYNPVHLMNDVEENQNMKSMKSSVS